MIVVGGAARSVSIRPAGPADACALGSTGALKGKRTTATGKRQTSLRQGQDLLILPFRCFHCSVLVSGEAGVRLLRHIALDLAVADADGAMRVGGDVGLVRDEHDGVAGLVQARRTAP